MLDNLSNIFDEKEENVMQRLSMIFLSLFVFYIVTYYGLLRFHLGCYNFPGYLTLIVVILFHIIQVVIIKKLHDDEQFIYIWVILVAPVLIYLIFLKYSEYHRRQQAKQMNYMMYQMQQQNQPQMYPPPQMVPQTQSASPPQMMPQMQQMGMQSFQYPPTATPYSDMSQMNDAYANYQNNTAFNGMTNMNQPMAMGNGYGGYGGYGGSGYGGGGAGGMLNPFE